MAAHPGDVVKWLNTEVCKTSIQRFESARRLQSPRKTAESGRSDLLTAQAAYVATDLPVTPISFDGAAYDDHPRCLTASWDTNDRRR